MTKWISVLFLMIVIFISGCSSVVSQTPPSSTSTVPIQIMDTLKPSDTPELTIIISNTPTSPAEGTNKITNEITIIGKVMDVALSARVIQLEQPVEGINSIALTDKTKIISVNGEETGLQSITHGAQIQATGKMGSPGSLVAIQIALLEE